MNNSSDEEVMELERPTVRSLALGSLALHKQRSRRGIY